MSSKDTNGTGTMHSQSNNIKIKIGNKINDVITQLTRYLIGLKESMKDINFFFYGVDLLHYNVAKQV